MKSSVAFLAFATLFILSCSAQKMTFQVFKQKLLAVKKESLPESCKTLFRQCAPNLFALMPLLLKLEKSWDQFQGVSCVKSAFDEGFPNYSWECQKASKYEKSVQCMLSDDVTNLFGISKPKVQRAVKCLLDNVS
ncbi:hypothetical protein MRX96_018350 [Rhipicephalus microplus]